MIEDKIKRINELANKSKTVGLTEEEKAEQAQLRADYIANVRRNLRGQLDNIVIVDEDGKKTPLKKKSGAKDE